MTALDPKLIQEVKNALAKGNSKEEIYQAVRVAIESEQAHDDTSKKTIHLILTIGVILIGVGIFSFIAANWLVMTKAIKISVILISMIVAYGTGWYLKEKSTTQKAGDALILLGSIIYGAGIFLVGQMFHLPSNWPDGFILWMIGTLAMALAIGSYPLFYLALALGVIALCGYPAGILSSFGSSSLILTSSLLLFVATISTYITGWIIRRKIT